MNLSATVRIALFFALASVTASSTEKPVPAYQHGTITGWSMKYYPGGFSSKHKFYELKGVDVIYEIDSGGTFRKCGPFEPQQTVDYRVEEKYIYIRSEGAKENKCGITGSKSDSVPAAP